MLQNNMLQNQRTSELLDNSQQEQGRRRSGQFGAAISAKAIFGDNYCHALALASSVIFLRIATIAASLAQLLANSGKRVIMVDCDLRNPSLSANLAPNAGGGIIGRARSLDVAVLGIGAWMKSGRNSAGRTADEWRARIASSIFRGRRHLGVREGPRSGGLFR
jgi:hypothetical protein